MVGSVFTGRVTEEVCMCVCVYVYVCKVKWPCLCDLVKKVVSSSVGHHDECKNLSSSAKDISALNSITFIVRDH